MLRFLLPLLALSILIAAPQRAITPEPHEAARYGATYISVADAKRLHDEGRALFCDTRLTREFIMETIPGAVACLYDEKGGMANRVPDFDPSAETWHNEKVRDKSRVLVVFCNASGCWRSYKAAVVAGQQGYREVYWLRDGVPGWKDAGHDTESNCPL